MKKISNIIRMMCFITGIAIIFEGIGGTAFIRKQLGIVTTYADEMNEFSLFHPEHLTSAQDLNLESSEVASRFKNMSTCHKTISTSRCHQILTKTFNLVPNFIIDTIYEQGYQIMLVGNDIRELVRLETGWDATYYYDGVTFPGYEGYTQIWSSSRGGVDILLHEIGHAYDFSMNKISSSEEVQKLFQSESKKLFFIKPISLSNESEFFAETFSLYLTKPWLLNLFAPNTHTFFENLIEANQTD